MASKAFVFGDVHGEADLLESLIRRVRDRFGDDIDIYSTGDLVDRGPDSRRVIDICIREGVKGVLGNHELWLHQFFTDGVFDTFALHRAMRGDRTLQSYGVDPSAGIPEITAGLKANAPREHRQFILGLPVWRKFELDGVVYRLIHAGLKKPDVTGYRYSGMAGAEALEGDALLTLIARVQPAVLLWSSPSLNPANLHHFPDGVQVFGHIPLSAPMLTKKWIGLDTGAGTCPPYSLSGVILPDREVVTVNALSDKIGQGFSDI